MRIALLFILIIIAILKISIVNLSAVPKNDSVQISLLLDSDQKVNISENDKPILRYGFQQTRECKVYEKAFLCIRKCTDLGYEIANADKQCFCTCKRNKVLGSYKKPNYGPTKWKMGAPTTSLPSWVKKQSTKLSAQDEKFPYNLTDFELYQDVSEPTESNGTAQSGKNENSSAGKEVKPGTNEEESPGTKEEEKPGTNEEVKPDTNLEESPDTKTEEKPVANEEETPDAKEEEKPGANVEESPGTKNEEKPGAKEEEKPVTNAEESTDRKAEEKPGAKDEEKPGAKEEEKPGTKVEEPPVTKPVAKEE